MSKPAEQAKPTEPTEVLGGYRPLNFSGHVDFEKDAQALHDAMKGLGTKESVLIEILTSREPAEMWNIAQVFEKKYGKSLKNWIEADTTGNFEFILKALVDTPVDFDVKELHDAMSGIGTRESVLIDILVTRSNAELNAIKQAYLVKYKDLGSAIKGDTSGKFEKGLLMLLEANRSEDLKVNEQLAMQQALELFKAGEKAWGTNEDTFLKILTKNSVAQNAAVSKAYEKHTSKHTLEHAIRSETGGDFESLLLALVNPARYIAELFRKAISSLDTKEKRIVALGRRANKVFLRAVKNEYRLMYKDGLVHEIESQLHGDLMKAIRRMLCTSQSEYRAVLLREAMKGMGTDDKALVTILGDPSLSKQDLIFTSKAYERDYNTTLRKAIESETSSNFCKLLIGLVTPHPVFKAEMLNKAMAGVGTTETILIDILTSTPTAEIEKIKEAYSKEYSKSLIDAVKGDTSGDFENILVKLLSTKRNVGMTINQAKAKEIATQLYKGGEGRLGTNDDLFISIFTTHSCEELQLIDKEYKAQYGHPLTDAIQKETSGNYRETLYACLNSDKYACNLIFKSMKGVGTDDSGLICAIATRDSTTIQRLAKEFPTYHPGHDMKKMIIDDTSGNYQNLLLTYAGFIRS